MASEWFYTQNGQQAPAPVSAAELKRLATAGQLLPTDLVWREGMANWVPASSIKDLFPPSHITTEPAPADRNATPRALSRATRDDLPVEKPKEKPAGEGGLVNLHPLLVLLLTLLTGGLFGLFYSFKVCRAYSSLAAKRGADSAGRPLGRVRHPLGILLLAYLTAGFYFYYWVYAVMRECNAYTGRQDFNLRAELALMLINPLYAFYLAVFRLPETIRRTQRLAGIPEPTAVGPMQVFLIPFMFCFLPFLGMHYQDALNQAWLTAP
jgi:hypothetical protein